MEHFRQKLSFVEKFGYSLGDGAANLVFQVLMSYQFFFFTAIMGLKPAAAGTMFLIGRVFDAFTDPAIGILADRTKSRWGRFRPWIIWSSLPLAAIFWLTFTSPGWSPSGQTIYAYIMYFLLMAAYTANNVPYCALSGVMTGDIDERTSLSTFRFATVAAVQFIVKGLTWPLVAKLGHGDDARGWSVTMGIFAVISVCLFLVCFLSVRERVRPDPANVSTARQDMLDAFRNRPWMVLSLATIMVFIMLMVRGGSLTFYVQSYVDQSALSGFLKSLGLHQSADAAPTGLRSVLDTCGLLVGPDGSNVPNIAYGIFMMAGTICTLLGIFSSKPLSKVFGKRDVFLGTLILTAAANVWLFFIPADDISSLLLQTMSWGLAFGPSIPLLWSMIADTADYSEWKTGHRATGFIFAGVVFALKLGLGIGGFFQGWILDSYGYEGGVDLTERAVLGFRLLTTLYPAVFAVAAAVTLAFYPISKALNYQISDDLARRRHARSVDD